MDISQMVFSKSSLNVSTAKLMIEAAERKAVEIGMPVSIAIVDESGVQKAFSRMDGAPLISVSSAIKKALTAVGFGIATGESWYQFIKDDPILLAGAQHLENFILLGGGLPIIINSQIVGAVGVSGGHYKKDEQCAAAALEVIAVGD